MWPVIRGNNTKNVAFATILLGFILDLQSKNQYFSFEMQLRNIENFSKLIQLVFNKKSFL